MKKLHLFLCAIAFVFVSCALSNEDKAEKLIKKSIIETLYNPDSYEPISTQVDSSFINFENILKFGELIEELGELLAKEQQYQIKYKFAEKMMSIYVPTSFYYSEHSRVNYNQYKQEYEEYKEKLEKLTPKISSIINELREVSKDIITEEHTGWIVSHRFNLKDDENSKIISRDMVYVCDIKFSQCGNGVDSKAFEIMLKLIRELSKATSDEDFMEILTESM